ncbi:MAG: rSAM/selenodomain-associated transferase 2 [Candidatus Omnitrophota bacterium]|jgi:rSAM/selenodomain-associated transferase 2
MNITIIIPTLNEEQSLPTTLAEIAKRYTQATQPQIIVADCQSKDNTLQIAKDAGATTISISPDKACRAEAMNIGAKAASGDILLFLDADTLPPKGFDSIISKALATPAMVGGAFELRLVPRTFAIRVVEACNRVRYRMRQCYFGDQAIFVKKEAFNQVGGYPITYLMESARLCLKLKRIGKICLLRPPVLSSGRRFVEGGILKVFLKDMLICMYEFFNIPLTRFEKKYRQYNLTNHTS